MSDVDKTPYAWLEKLPQLNSLLLANGITVNADVWVRVYDLFIAQYQQNRLPEDPARLENALSGLIVTSAEQQKQFKGLYRQWLSTIGSAEAAQADQDKKSRQEKQQAEFENKEQEQRKNRSVVKTITIALLLLAIISMVVVYLWPEKVVEPPIVPTPVVSTSIATTTTTKPIMALQPTPLRQDLLPKAQSASQNFVLDLIGKGLPFLPISLFGFFLWARWQRWQEVLKQQKGDPKDPLSVISLSDKAESAESLFSSPLLSSALRALHNPIKVLSQTLSMRETAEATANAAGYFTPKYQQRAYIPQCIMMISYQHGQDQASGLALLMQQRLLHAGLEVYTYLFQGTPEHLYALEGMKATSLAEVTMRYPQGNLLLISDPDIYLSAWSGELQPWANAISQWQQRALLTTRPTTEAMRKAFDALQLHSASLSSEGLKQISQTLAGVRKASEVNTSQHPLPPELARLTINECGEELSEEEQQEQIDALHLFCDPQTFRLLTVVAAYPELHWPLTQRIESELCADQSMVQREQRLLNLLRLPWLRAGKIPKWLRLYCYYEQSLKQHQETQALYRSLFHQAEIKAEGNDSKDYLALPFNASAAKKPHQAAFLRWLKTLNKAQESTLDDSLWEDQIFVDTLWGKPKDLDVPLTKRLAVRLPKGRWGRLYPRIALWSTAALLLGVILHQSWQSKGREEFQALLPPAGLSAGLASTPIEILINKPESYETGAQLVQFEQQKQAAKLLTEALKQQGVTGEINTSIAIAATSDQVSRISYNTTQQELAALAAKQLAHITWGNTSELSAANTSDTLKIQLNRLIQEGSTFSDQAKPLSKSEKETQLILFNSTDVTLTDMNKYIFGSNDTPFTVFSDVSKDNVPLPQMVALPSGTFLMGSPESEHESPQHDVTISAFAMSQTEITFEQYDAFADATKREKPSDQGWGRGQRPVINVSWDDAKAYTAWVSEQTGQVYRLPSESEWEYAARAGTQTQFSTGDCIHTDVANYNDNFEYNNCGAKTDVYREKTTTVSELAPNSWGLYAMHGNVWEWVEDCYQGGYDGAPDDGSARQEAECAIRVLRGGGWNLNHNYIRSAFRFWSDPDVAINLTGFRIARAL
ncbi:formylglycine-generating enzyme family protein [Leucothrix arctica]|uniref:Sulfatase-modifying factor enzyme-like domain-containing protein n=1 Tax=Leucothrix arctica TaxID=1481894 RepID=A0A317C7Z9_9GAMM|nr:formylglycine-generating enzyme family protein [Leucothrix arctica]PWQ94775.1 hypothetical protein DKT75_15955 [Leucothrix arctica]